MQNQSVTGDKNKTNKQIDHKINELFPRKPYPTQFNIARQLYLALEQKKVDVVIVESPTGTGKTYALLVGVLAWLSQNPYTLQQDSKDKQLAIKQGEGKQNEESNSLPSWLAAKTSQNKLSRVLHEKEEKVKKLKTIKEYKQGAKNRHKQNKKEPKENLSWEVQDIEDGQLDEINKGKGGVKRLNRNADLEQILSDECLPKLIFVSRTHSQLGQVMESIAALPMQWKYISMASKDHFCVHSQLQKNRVHQKCQYLLSHGGCPYYHQQPISDFFGLRVEQAQKVGQENSLCSYFSIKNLLPLSDIICLPYSSILNPQIRTRLSINLKNSIVIFDEAHNIIEQQLSIKSPEICYKDLQQFCQRIDEYRSKYGSKMMEPNLNLICHMQDILRALMSVMKVEHEKALKKTNEEEEVSYVKMTKVQLFCKLKLSEIRVSRIKNYISLSNFDQKLVHFNSKQTFSLAIINNFLDFITNLTTSNANKTTFPSSSQPPLESTLVLVKNLPCRSTSTPLQSCSIKIYCMQSTEIAEIVKQSRLVILAGGTMQPINSYTNIFNLNNLAHKFMKGQHVIKDDQCNVYCIDGIRQDKRDKLTLTFTYNQMRNHSKAMIESACKIISHIVSKKTEKNSGTVLFIQNYGLLDSISNCLGETISGIPIYYDAQSQPNRSLKNQKQNKGNTTNAFERYQKTIEQKKSSAVLVSVMGGRLSEGINFSDELARSIIVLGLPYPNLKSAEMIEKMKYLDLKLKHKFNSKQGGMPCFESGKKIYKMQNETSESEQTGQSYYQNCCVRTINQTIGRGIRHAGDYANIYLIDSRFAGMAHRLPSWMSKRVKYIDSYEVQ